MTKQTSSQPDHAAAQTTTSGDARYRSEVQSRLGSAWMQRGNPDQAMLKFRQALDIDPANDKAYLKLDALLRHQGQLADAVQLLQNGLSHDPTLSELHKALVDALLEAGGPEAVFAYYELERQDSRPITIAADAVLCCVVVRNEAERLPYFLSYYRNLGVERFLVVDNGSTDGTLDLLMAQADVYVWRSTLHFKAANFGAGWWTALLRQHAQGRWCLIVDADELFTYAGYEDKNLPQLCQELEQESKSAMNAVLLDMYAGVPISATVYRPGQPFIEVCPYFDREFYHTAQEYWGPYHNITALFGGLRQRVFGPAGRYLQSKVPLLRYNADCVLNGGQHWTNRPRSAISDQRGCLLHFKFFATFPAYVQQEVARQQHADGAMQYGQYALGLRDNAALNLFDAQRSIRFSNSQQLIELGIIVPNKNRVPTNETVALPPPPIPPLQIGGARPLWSVMVTAYTRSSYLVRALRSVLESAPDESQMQIEVINDAADPAMQATLAELVRTVGGGRVLFYSHFEHLGHPQIFNLCIERARGRLVHILHDDDWVAPGFYGALAAMDASDPQAGAGFCRHIRADQLGRQLWISPLERETAGPIDDWLERIAIQCRLQFAAMVVRREVYEALGGFAPEAGSAFDWDMWKRIAIHYPVWYEPRALAYFTQGADAETHHVIKSGQQISDARRAISLAQSYLPGDQAADLSARAGQQYAEYALNAARQQQLLGDKQAALVLVREALACGPAVAVERELVQMLARLE